MLFSLYVVLHWKISLSLPACARIIGYRSWASGEMQFCIVVCCLCCSGAVGIFPDHVQSNTSAAAIQTLTCHQISLTGTVTANKRDSYCNSKLLLGLCSRAVFVKFLLEWGKIRTLTWLTQCCA